MRYYIQLLIVLFVFICSLSLGAEEKKTNIEKFKKKAVTPDSLKSNEEEELDKFLIKSYELKKKEKAHQDSLRKQIASQDTILKDFIRKDSLSTISDSTNLESIKTSLIKKAISENSQVLTWKDSLNFFLLSTAFNDIIHNINVRNADIRDILRGLSHEHSLNLIIDNDIERSATISLNSVKIIDFLFFICDEYHLKMKQSGNILKIFPVPEISKDIIDVFNKKLTIDISSTPVESFVRKFSESTGINIILNKDISTNVSGRVFNIEIEKGLKIFLENNGLTLYVKDDIFFIDKKTMTGDSKGDSGLQGNSWVTVKDSLVSFNLINASIINIINEIIHQSGQNLITYGSPEGKISAKVNNISLEQAFNYLLKGTDFTYRRENNAYILGNKNVNGIITTRLFKLKHIKVDGIDTMFPDFIKKGITLNIIKEQNGILVVGTNDILMEIESFLNQIDQPTPQILIEALVVDYNLSSLRDIGIKMGTKYISTDSTAWRNFSFLDMGVNNDGKLYTQQDGASVNYGMDKLTDWLGVKKIGNLPDQFYVQLQALEQEGKANIKSKPQIATLNGHTAKISIGTTQYYILKSTTPIKSTTDVVTQETERFEKVEANVTLSITPWVSSSGEVTVEVKPEFLTPVGNFDSKTPPTINSRILESTVRLKDGETIILGGLIEEKDNKIARKVPLLGDIPFLGKLFRTNYTSKSKTELMIYITPHVFYGDETESLKWNELSKKYPYED